MLSFEALQTIVVPVNDNDATKHCNPMLVYRVRQLCKHLDPSYDGPVVFQHSGGFDIKHGAPDTGLCHGNFEYLQAWMFDDNPTAEGLVFGLPHIPPVMLGRSAQDQLALIASLRQQFGLPEHFFRAFPSVQISAAMVLSEYVRHPGDGMCRKLVVRTGTQDPRSQELFKLFPVGDTNQLMCGAWFHGEGATPDVGCLMLGFEGDLRASEEARVSRT